MDEFYTVNQTAIILKVHPLTIRRYIKEGKLKAVKIGGNIRIAQSAINDFTKNIDSGITQTKKTTSIFQQNKYFNLDDPIFRIKGSGLSIKSI